MKHYYFILFYILCNLLIFGFQGGWLVYLLFFLFFITIVSLGAFDIELKYFVDSICKKHTPNKEVALTFDDGPTEFTPLYLDLLKEYNVKATFFCIGKQIEKYPETFNRIIKEGHSIGNHTYSHSHSTGFLSTQEMIAEIKKCDEVMLKIGNYTTPLYRPPFGVTNPNIYKALKKTSKKSIGWNIRSLDTVIDSEKKIYNRICKRITKGNIILMHDTSMKSFNVLEELLLFLK